MFRAAMWKTTEASATSVADQLRVRHRALDELDGCRQRLGAPGEQVVQDGDAGALLHEPADHGPADEAGAAGDQHAAAGEGALQGIGHRFTPNRRRRAGRNSRHQSRIPRIFVYPSAAWYRTVTGCSTTR